MKTPLYISIIATSLLMVGVYLVDLAYCFDDKQTHPKLTDSAVRNSNLNNYLINTLDIPEGVEKTYKEYTFLIFPTDKSITKWLQQGSTDEDSPMCRASTHFHNPLLPWDQSYMSDSPLWINTYCFGWTRYSNITWATGYTARDSALIGRSRQDMGWDNARDYFYTALTSTTNSDREKYFVKTFRAVGQAMHLLQDVAVPAHVRNDFKSHLIFNGIKSFMPTRWFGNPFEHYVATNPGLISISSPVDPGFSAPKTTDFWDSDNNGTIKGLAEITNAGYFSNETIPNNSSTLEHTFELPQLISPDCYVCTDFLPNSNKPTKYVSRKSCPQPGGAVDHFAAFSLMNKWADTVCQNIQVKKVWLDKNVHNTYAQDLLPKAVGYSTGLLNHFFRGNVSIAPVTGGVTFRNVKITVQNTSVNNEEMPLGEVALVIRYLDLKVTMPGNTRVLNLPDEEYTYKVAKLQNVQIPRITPVELTFDFSSDLLPTYFADLSMQLVYRGKLGNEDGAIAVSSIKPLDGIYPDFHLLLPSTGVFANATANSFDELRVSVLSNTSGGLSIPNGKIELALEYRLATSDPFLSLPVNTEPVNAAAYIIRVPEKNGVAALPQGVPIDLVFDLSATQLPVTATDVYLNVLYTDISTSKTMAVGYRDISEPTPVDIFNNTDKVCINRLWYTAGSPEAIAQVDTNHNGIADELDVYPHTIANIYYKASPAPSPVLASSTAYTLNSPAVLTGGSFRRLGFILTDYSFKYSNIEDWLDADPTDPWETTSLNEVLEGTAVRNQLDDNGIITYPLMYTRRGYKMWSGTSMTYVNSQDEDIQCGWDKLN